jgi:hypothetical protein
MSKPIKDVQLFNDLCAVENLLEKDGWCKEALEDNKGRHCLIGAAAVVAWDDSDNKRWCKLKASLGGCLVIMNFNDAPETTFEDVRARIRAARDALVNP